MPKPIFEPCIPTRCTKVPHHPDWIHEVKQDGFRLIVSRDGERVRLFTRNGYDWTSRYPLIVEAARRIRTSQVLLGVDGISDFDGLYSGKQNNEVQLYAFDISARQQTEAAQRRANSGRSQKRESRRPRRP
jgi:bifunctional non-homologous end joining protein LigD